MFGESGEQAAAGPRLVRGIDGKKVRKILAFNLWTAEFVNNQVAPSMPSRV
jgi:hypothetical protein